MHQTARHLGHSDRKGKTGCLGLWPLFSRGRTTFYASVEHVNGIKSIEILGNGLERVDCYPTFSVWMSREAIGKEVLLPDTKAMKESLQLATEEDRILFCSKCATSIGLIKALE